MGLLTLTQIPCHHVLANEIALNLKYHIVLKHFFNINLGIGIIKKTTFFISKRHQNLPNCFLSGSAIGMTPNSCPYLLVGKGILIFPTIQIILG